MKIKYKITLMSDDFDIDSFSIELTNKQYESIQKLIDNLLRLSDEGYFIYIDGKET